MSKLFFEQFLKQKKDVGSILPSSSFLTRAMLRPIHWSTATHVIELGAGTGVMTHEMLRRLPRGSRLTCFETNDEFFQMLQAIADPRLCIEQRSAWDIRDRVDTHSVDVVVSGLPLSNFSVEEVRTLLIDVRSVLKPGGLFVQFQYLPLRLSVVRHIFSDLRIVIEPRNMPPAWVYIASSAAVFEEEDIPVSANIRLQEPSVME